MECILKQIIMASLLKQSEGKFKWWSGHIDNTEFIHVGVTLKISQSNKMLNISGY